MKHVSKPFSILIIVLLFLSGSLASVPVKATATIQVTLSVATNLNQYNSLGGSAFWVDNTPPLPNQGGTGTFNMQVGRVITFDATPNTGYSFSGWNAYVNGALVQTTTQDPVSITLGTTSFTLTAMFSTSSVIQYSIAATSDLYSYISPVGNELVTKGDSATFTFGAYSGYVVSSVTVDGSSVATTSPYTFANVQTSHTIHITSAPISSPSISVQLVLNNAIEGNGFEWTDFGNSPLPVLNPTVGGSAIMGWDYQTNTGTYAFNSGDSVLFQAFPNSTAGFTFENFTLTGGYSETITQNPVYITVQAPFTITANFNYQPATVYTIQVAASYNGTLNYNDNTQTPVSETPNTVNPQWDTLQVYIGDNVTFTATPAANCYFNEIQTTWGLLGGYTTNSTVSFIVQTDFNISASFSVTPLTGDAIMITVSPTPLNGNSANQTAFTLEQGINYVFTASVMIGFSETTLGTYCVSKTSQVLDPTVLTNYGAQWLTTAYQGNAPISGLTPYARIWSPYIPVGSYSTPVLNVPFVNAFSFGLNGSQLWGVTVYQGIILTINSTFPTVDNFDSSLIALTWLTPAQSSTYSTPTPPTATPNPNAQNSLTDFLNWLGVGWLVAYLWTPTMLLVYGIITLAGMSLGLTYVMRKKNSVTGLTVGITLALIINRLAFNFPLWTLIICVVCIIFLIITRS